MQLLITRPEPDASQLAARLRDDGHETVIAPLIEVIFPDTGPIALENVDGLIATSRNGLRAFVGNDSHGQGLHLPLFVVGAATAELAKTAGFKDIHIGEGTAKSLVQLIDSHQISNGSNLLHLAGDHHAFDLKGALEAMGFQVSAPMLYVAKAVEHLSHMVISKIETGDLEGVVLLSPRTAEIYHQLVERHGVGAQARKLIYFCLSKRVAERLQNYRYKNILNAEHPDLAGIISTINHRSQR